VIKTKEIIRIKHGAQYESNNNILRDYNLEVYAGEIIYIQGLSGSGVMALFDLLSGNSNLDTGEIYLNEKKITECNQSILLQNGIYTINAELGLVNSFTVAENMEAIRKVGSLVKIFSKKKAVHKVNSYLDKEGVLIRGDSIVREVTQEEKIKLSILKAKLYEAKVIVLDFTTEYYEGIFAKELGELISRINQEGISFVILSERLLPLIRVANRVQLVQNGIDLMEWDYYDDAVKSILFQQVEYRKEFNMNPMEKMFLGLYDYYWGMDKNIWEYLDSLKKDNPGYWDNYLNVKLLKPGLYYDGETVIIPKESSSFLLNNFGIVDNIAITIPKRIGKSKYGILRKKYAIKVAKDFYKIIGVADKMKSIEDLNNVQKKILSIYRWEVARPKVIILEYPYIAMDIAEIEILRNYLKHVALKGIHIVCFSNSLEEMKYDCNIIISTENGKNTVLI